MRLYSGSSRQFIQDTAQNQIAEKLKAAFFQYYRYNPSPAEVGSWRNSLRATSLALDYSRLHDHGVILEYQLPFTSKRLDCLVSGRNRSGADNAVIIELKQWESCGEAEGENEVSTWLGGSNREILHPSVQVGQYRMYLQDNLEAFHQGPAPIQLNACAYLHNYSYQPGDPLLSPKFEKTRSEQPLFSMDDVDPLRDYLIDRLSGGHGLDVLKRVEQSRYRPSRKLMEHVGGLIRGRREYVLLDEQLVIYDMVLAMAKSGFRDKRKTAVIVKGGPGTGKSVIAINLMADLLLQSYNAHYATGSKAFTETLRKIIGARGAIQFKYFNSYMQADPNAVDVLVADESHRLRKTSNNRFTRRDLRTDLPQVEELIRAAKVSVFFIDDHQVVRPDEVGSVEHIRESAGRMGCDIREYELEAQFRCSGSDAFVNWINNTLGVRRTANVIWEGTEAFEFKIFDTPQALENAIREKVARGNTGRITAGFCWAWSKPRPDGTLPDDVAIDGYQRPWNAKHDARKLAPGIPPAHLWAHDPGGIDQIGCVYTAQGFEFDYVGVIFGKDLVYDFDGQTWVGRKDESADPAVRRNQDRFADLIKNTYRVLLSRGLKGCYVYFVDKETERFFKSRMEPEAIQAAQPQAPVRDRRPALIPVDDPRVRSQAFKTLLPLYSLKAACGKFGEGEEVEPEGWMEADSIGKLDKEMFVARAAGRSMEPKIHDGDYLVFRAHPKGTRQGKIVLAQYRGPADPETGGAYTVKRYRSEKTVEEDSWRHEAIHLEPLNLEFKPIVIRSQSQDDVKIIAELISLLP